MVSLMLKARPVTEAEDRFAKIDVLLHSRWFGRLHFDVRASANTKPVDDLAMQRKAQVWQLPHL